MVPASMPRAPSAASRADASAAQAPAGGDAVAHLPTRYTSEVLFGDAVEVEIVHRQQVYRLRRTSQGKLILTK